MVAGAISTFVGATPSYEGIVLGSNGGTIWRENQVEINGAQHDLRSDNSLLGMIQWRSD